MPFSITQAITSTGFDITRTLPAITHVSTTEYFDNDSSTTTSTIALVLPANIPNNSLAVVHFNYNSGSTIVTSSPSNSTYVHSAVSGSTNTLQCYVIPVGASDSSTTVSWTLSVAHRRTATVNIFTATPGATINVLANATTNAATQNFLANSSLTATTLGQAYISCWSTRVTAPDIVVPTFPSGYVPAGTPYNSWASGANVGMATAYKFVNPGSVGGDTANFSMTIPNIVASSLLLYLDTSAPVQRMKVWNGTSYDLATPKVWNGTSWDTAVAKRWDGSSWS